MGILEKTGRLVGGGVERSLAQNYAVGKAHLDAMGGALGAVGAAAGDFAEGFGSGFSGTPAPSVPSWSATPPAGTHPDEGRAGRPAGQVDPPYISRIPEGAPVMKDASNATRWKINEGIGSTGFGNRRN